MTLPIQWSPRFRITPSAGNQYVVDVSGYRFLAQAHPDYAPDVLRYETINRKLVNVFLGWRCSIVLAFAFAAPSTDEGSLKTLLLDAASDDLARIEGSLDAGATYRDVVFSDQFKQVLMNNRWQGIVQTLIFDCVELLPQKPAVGSGSW